MKTPQESYKNLNQVLGVETYLKREDLNAFGSHKGRSIPHMIEYYVKHEHKNSFVISSSGNAARAAIKYVTAHNRNNSNSTIKLNVFIGKNIAPEKKILIETEKETDTNISITQVKRPKQSALQLEKEGEAINLRQSTDDKALEGYHELGKELSRIPNLSAIFIPTSSGTTAQALGEFFEKLAEPKPQIHIIQTESCHPIAENFDKEFSNKESSIAEAIVDNIAHRKENVIEAIKKSNGSGWIITDAKINETTRLIEETCDIKISPNAALSIAGLQKALGKGRKFEGPVACLVTGI